MGLSEGAVLCVGGGGGSVSDPPPPPPEIKENKGI